MHNNQIWVYLNFHKEHNMENINPVQTQLSNANTEFFKLHYFHSIRHLQSQGEKHFR